MSGNAQLDTSISPARLRVSGDWTLAHYAELKHLTEQLTGQYDANTVVDLNSLGALDTAGASLLVESRRPGVWAAPPNTLTARFPRLTARCCKRCIAR